MPCCSIYNKKFNQGSIIENSILDIFNSDSFNELRKNIRLDNRQEIEMCKKCDISYCSISGRKISYDY